MENNSPKAEKKGVVGVIVFSVIILLIIVGFFYFLFQKGKEEVVNPNPDNPPKVVSEKDKIIKATSDKIDPNNYSSVEEFLHYFNEVCGINRGIDLENETFYIKIAEGDAFVITRFDKELINGIDNAGEVYFKNLAITDIFASCKEEGAILPEGGNGKSGVRILEDWELPVGLQLHNDILNPGSGENTIQMKTRLLNQVDNSTSLKETYMQLAYLYDFEGNYKEAKFYKERSADVKVKYTISGRVLSNGNAVKGAKINLLNYNIETTTDDAGKYTLEFETYPLTRLRLRAIADGLSDGYNGVFVLNEIEEQSSKNIDFTLHKYDSVFTLNTEDLKGGKTKTITSTKGNSFTFEEGNVLTDKGIPYIGKFTITIFEFNRETPNMNSFLELDTFDGEFGYVGNSMRTFGMTYLLIKDVEGNELFISKGRPILTKQLLDIDLMKKDDLKDIGILPLTDEQLDLIVRTSEEGGYPITNGFFEKYQIPGFSSFRVLNSSRGVWENQGMRVYKEGDRYYMDSFYYNVD